MKTKHGIIIVTNSYAGNFKREMCAYITGHIGDCEVGEEFVYEEDVNELIDLFSNVRQVPDDHGCYRPVAMLASDEQFDTELSHTEKLNSLVIYFEYAPTEEQIKVIKERANQFPEIYKDTDIKVLDFMIVTTELKTTITKI